VVEDMKSGPEGFSGGSFHLPVMLNAGMARGDQAFARAEDTGVEISLATNHLGHFLFVDLLQGNLVSGSRVVVLASAVHYFARGVPLTREEASDPLFYRSPAELPSLERLVPSPYAPGEGLTSRLIVALSKATYKSYKQGDEVGSGDMIYSGAQAYAVSKFANLLYAQELARRLEPAGVLVSAVHPGVVWTNLSEDIIVKGIGPDFMKDTVKALFERVCSHPALGVVWPVELGTYAQVFAAAGAGAASLPSGSYIIPPGKPGIKDPRLADLDTQEKFWRLSEDLVSGFRD